MPTTDETESGPEGRFSISTGANCAVGFLAPSDVPYGGAKLFCDRDHGFTPQCHLLTTESPAVHLLLLSSEFRPGENETESNRN